MEESFADVFEHLSSIFDCVWKGFALQSFSQPPRVRVTAPAVDINLPICQRTIVSMHDCSMLFTLEMPFLMHSTNSSSGSSSVPCRQSGTDPLKAFCKSFRL